MMNSFRAPHARVPRRVSSIFRAGTGAALLLLATPALTQIAPDLGSTTPYAIVSETFSNVTAGTSVAGDVCFTTGPAEDPTVTGAVLTPCPPQTGIDQNAARAELDAQSCTSIGAAVALDEISIGGGAPGVFPPGCYSSTGAMSIGTGATLTLSGDGVYIFRPGGALDPAANSSVVTANGACADNVFWTPAGGTTIGANASFVGNVFRGTAGGLSITLGDSASFEGRALAFGSTVTTANNTIAVPDACPGTGTGTGTITILKQANPSDTGESFNFSGDLGSFSLTHGEVLVETRPAGTYTVSEIVPTGWQLDSASCDDGSSVAAINLAADESVTCTFVNSQRNAPVGVPIFSPLGIALTVLLMLAAVAVFPRYLARNRR